MLAGERCFVTPSISTLCIRRNWGRALPVYDYLDETYIKVKGAWYYLYRAVDKHGQRLCADGRSTAKVKEVVYVEPFDSRRPDHRRYREPRLLRRRGSGRRTGPHLKGRSLRRAGRACDRRPRAD